MKAAFTTRVRKHRMIKMLTEIWWIYRYSFGTRNWNWMIHVATFVLVLTNLESGLAFPLPSLTQGQKSVFKRKHFHSRCCHIPWEKPTAKPFSTFPTGTLVILVHKRKTKTFQWKEKTHKALNSHIPRYPVCWIQVLRQEDAQLS